MKQCTKCGKPKSLDDFSNRKSSKDGKRSQCKVCESESNSEWHKNNVERNRPRKKRWEENNPDKVKESRDKSREKERRLKPEQARARRKKWKDANPEKHKLSHLKNRLQKEYGITVEEFLFLKEKQGGCCALCGKKESEQRRLDVDHNHITGKVRGLLCNSCNKALGLFKDNPDVLLKAVSYVGA